jgi:hypothetical protein
MKLKILSFAAIAAFAFGAGINSAPVQAAGGCLTCHNRCDTNFEACLAAGTAYATCASRANLCHRGCGCPIP